MTIDCSQRGYHTPYLIGCVNGREQNGVMHDFLKRLVQWTCWITFRNDFSIFWIAFPGPIRAWSLMWYNDNDLLFCVMFPILFLMWCSQTVLQMVSGKVHCIIISHLVSISDCHCIKTNGSPIFCCWLILSLIGF